MVVTLEAALVLLFSLLDLPPALCMSRALCPHTTFYHGCWIRRFPGLRLNLSGSERRGVRVLQRYPEPSAQICSRRCCDQESCNVAVFYSEPSAGAPNCQLVHCPHPESCLILGHKSATLFTANAGVDPDLLIFEKSGPVDWNSRSSLKGDRMNASRPQGTSAPAPSQVSPTKAQKASSSPQVLPADSAPEQSPPQQPSPEDSPLRSFPPTPPPLQTPTSEPDSSHVTPSVDRSHHGGDFGSKDFLPSSPPLDRPMSDTHSPAHLDSSKQHLNETKGHTGRNHSSDAEGEDNAEPSMNLWALPVLIGSTVTLICCCSGILTLGCCRRRRGRYKPPRARSTRKGTQIRCTLLKEKD
ncbi:MANSC domain-containing protein 4 [Gastrophryne carolinensis]